MALDKAKIYADSPGKKNVIHFNNAGASAYAASGA